MINIRSMIHDERFGEVIRFGIVGVIAVIIHNAVYWALLNADAWTPLAGCSDIREWTESPVWKSWAYTIGYFVSWCVNFWLSAHFTFRRKANVKRGIGFALSHISNYLMQMPCFWFFTWVGVPSWIVVVPVTCVCVPINFMLVRFVFKSRITE